MTLFIPIGWRLEYGGTLDTISGAARELRRFMHAAAGSSRPEPIRCVMRFETIQRLALLQSEHDECQYAYS